MIRNPVIIYESDNSEAYILYKYLHDSVLELK
jgi:hypothetical protein